MTYLMKRSGKDVSKEFVTSGKWPAAVLTGLTFAVAVVTLVLYLRYGGLCRGCGMYPMLFSGLLASMVIILESVPLVFAPSLFSRWKANYHKEKLEWDAFRNFLENFATNHKYLPKEPNIWKEWLVYGTALGVGLKFAEEMEQLNIKIPEIRVISYMYTYFGLIFNMTATSLSRSEGASIRRYFFRLVRFGGGK
jgi:uncharacterized membrane protein